MTTRAPNFLSHSFKQDLASRKSCYFRHRVSCFEIKEKKNSTISRFAGVFFTVLWLFQRRETWRTDITKRGTMGVTLNKQLRQENTEADKDKKGRNPTRVTRPCPIKTKPSEKLPIRPQPRLPRRAAVAIVAKNSEKPRVFSGSLFTQRCCSSGGTPPSNSITHPLDRISLDGAF